MNLHAKGILGSVTTPLHAAVWIAQFEVDSDLDQLILRELLKRGAFVSSKDESERTPLHIAAENNVLFAAEILLSEGAKVMPRDIEGKTPLDYAESGPMIRLLKKHGAKEQG